jgi:pimeloyl-ACP methyl ester carboxylesterase
MTDMMASVRHRRIQVNGITLHLAEAGAGPVVLLLHGVPELWYSWRHQIRAVADAGYHAIAADLRGCGQSEIPAAVESYSMSHLVADVVGVLDALGVESAVLAGHDWGAQLAWRCAETHPDRVSAVIALSVPYTPRGPESPSVAIERFAPRAFSMVKYFQRPGVAEAEIQTDVRRFFRLFLYGLSGDAPPELLRMLFTGKPPDASLLDGIPEPTGPLDWLTNADLDYYSREFQRTGFTGALNRYRNLDRDWQERAPYSGVLEQPALFVGGERDSAVVFGNLEPMRTAVPNLKKIVLLSDCGHWVQQERPHEVNTELIEFLRGHRRD